MASLPFVKPTDYEDFLQGYLNDHPSFGYSKLLKALELTMHVTCSKKAMRNWFSHHEPIIQLEDHEDFLLEQLAARPEVHQQLPSMALTVVVIRIITSRYSAIQRDELIPIVVHANRSC